MYILICAYKINSSKTINNLILFVNRNLSVLNLLTNKLFFMI